MIGQTIAIFVDAYRELNARKLFWIVMILSGLVVGAFALVTLTPTGLKLVIWEIKGPVNSEVIPARDFYFGLFVTLGVKVWLAWAATILALISTAGMIPDFLESGSIEAMLAKPIGRLRLFLTKYVSGLLFVVLQVSVFAFASFLLLGLKAGLWEPRVLLAIPIITIFYSYLFSFCALLGVLTRSTVASLLLTILLWLLIWGVHISEQTFLSFSTSRILQIERTHAVDEMLGEQISGLEKLIAEAEADLSVEDAKSRMQLLARRTYLNRQDRRLPYMFSSQVDPETPPASGMQALEERLEERQATREAFAAYITETEARGAWMTTTHEIVKGAKTILPKTAETVELLNRYLVDPVSERIEIEEPVEEGQEGPTPNDLAMMMQGGTGITLPPDVQASTVVTDAALAARLDERLRARSLAWVVGTSLLFELVLVSIAAWRFKRRDF